MLHDFVQRGQTVGRLPNDGRYFIQGEQSGIPARHVHRLIAKAARSNLGAPCHVPLRSHPIISQTLASGTTASRKTGTPRTNQKPAHNTKSTNAGSSPK